MPTIVFDGEDEPNEITIDGERVFEVTIDGELTWGEPAGFPWLFPQRFQ